ncbi:hypothetical protein [Pseudoalteromonas phage KB12-38]|nr:hypothetical protein [Pseudoalteromonas phage KB12-38]
MIDTLFFGLFTMAILHVVFADYLYKRFSRPPHEKLATKIVLLRIEMMKKPVMERQEDLKLIARLEAQYQFMIGEVTVKRPIKGLEEVEKEKAKVIPLRRLK